MGELAVVMICFLELSVAVKLEQVVVVSVLQYVPTHIKSHIHTYTSKWNSVFIYDPYEQTHKLSATKYKPTNRPGRE